MKRALLVAAAAMIMTGGATGAANAATPIRLATTTSVTGENDKGQVVGTYEPQGATVAHGFVWQSGKLTDLGTANPVAINDAGQIIAYKWVADNQIGLVLDHGKTITLKPTSGTSCDPAVISDTGLVAGTTNNNMSSATVWQIPAGD